MGLTLADPYFAQQIIQKYSILGTGFSEAVDFVYYAPETQEKRTYQTNLFLQMFFRFQMIHLNTFISAGNQQIMDQVLSHAMNRILLRILTKKEQHAALFKLDRILKEIQKNAAAKAHSAKKEERLMKESMRFLTFLKEHPELLSERETLVRLADESGGKEAEYLIHQYFFRPEESVSNNEEQKEQIQTILQNMVKKNQRQLSVLFQGVEEKLQYQNDRQSVTSGTTSQFKQAGMTEGRLLYETVRLLFQESGIHNREWEQLMVLTGRRLGPEVERRLRQECELGLEMGSRQEVENGILEAFHTKVSGRENAADMPVWQKNQAQLNEAAITEYLKGEGSEKGRLLYEAVRLLFRDSGSRRKEWEHLMALTGRRLGAEAERRLHQDREVSLEVEFGQEIENEILKAFHTKESGRENTAADMQEVPGVLEISSAEGLEIAALRMFAEKEPEEFAELLKEAGITELPEFQRKLKQAEMTVWQKNQAQLNEAAITEYLEGEGSEKGCLLYEAVHLLFRKSGSSSREWEQLATLTGRHLGAETVRRLRQEREESIAVELESEQELERNLRWERKRNLTVRSEPEKEALGTSYARAEGRKSSSAGMSGMSGIQRIGKSIKGIKAFTGTIRKQSGILSAEAVSRLAQPLDPIKASGIEQQSFSMKPQIPHLNIRRESEKQGKVGEQLESMPSAPLQLMQRRRQREQELKENRSRIQKLEEQVQIQQRTVTRLTEGQRISVQAPLPNVNDLTRRVMSNLERELRLEKMRKGLL